ncbi:NAD-dependent epimerase/dehydratase family protein [Sphingomonas sp. AOB5]|uniref:NAD-dependent epimerase/dehydratase family protein n=1 Tax=Sphingomonas sp. AOB5 TaxID=3034017 RepID=UPI0023F9F577|nr:NAD-dependent epimerase/dehydratase family protein [Sphingomonas sp. AOB5]MDF7776393.1 NAD-dependent epimerase/dehydratase family protein [Sphingomonas sp. AOB5]
MAGRTITVTGAGGFVGRRLVDRLLASGDIAAIRAVDAHLPEYSDPRVHPIAGDLTDPGVRGAATAGGVDVLYHLAAVPGGAAEGNYELSRAVNVDATLALFESAAARSQRPRIVYTSTIAVFGADLPARVDDATPLAPGMTYGAHKLMMEIALADLHRRGMVDAVTLRLPGILARPMGPSGMKSAFMSELFHHLAAHRPFVVPVSPGGTIWAMSVDRCAANLDYAGSFDGHAMPAGRAVTLPALRIRLDELVAAVADWAGADTDLISYAPDAPLEAMFAANPPLETAAADRAGFKHDGDVATLVAAAFAALGIERETLKDGLFTNS